MTKDKAGHEGRVLKATALVVRAGDQGDEVLVFDHPMKEGHSTVQIPAGTIEPGEKPEVAAIRELLEETGVRGQVLGLAGVLDEVVNGERRRRWIYVVAPMEKEKDSWPYLCDCGAQTTCRWEPLESAEVHSLQVNWLNLGRDWYKRQSTQTNS